MQAPCLGCAVVTSTIARKLAAPLAVTALAWWYTVAHSGMTSMGMGASSELLSLTAMGSIMMIAMMLPAAIPWIAATGTGFAAGYGLIWMAFGAAAAALQWRFGGMPPIAVAAIAVAALFYERTPLKRRFLRACTDGMSLSAGRNAIVLGLRQGALCIGCCWVLMAALFALGATNLVLTIVVTTYVVAQRLLFSLGPVVATGSEDVILA
jgi:predicted metal-binding membrane protein